MSSNTDTQMTRFLFAILKQKNLKDIDWNAVAKDPVLSHHITNGHAARMRYSRFRSAMLGIEPQKRPRNNANKNKVTKPKKDTKTNVKTMTTTAADDDEDDDNSNYNTNNKTVKTESGVGVPPHCHGSPPNTNVKHEVSSQPNFNNFHFNPTSMVSQAHQNSPIRLLTPCSDDMLSNPNSLPFGSPVSSVLGAFDMASIGSPCGHEHDSPHGHVSEHNPWASSSPAAYSAFEAAYNLTNTYGLPDMCDHHHQQHDQGDTQQSGSGIHGSPAVGASMPGQVEVKNEPWDGKFRL